MFGDSIGDQGEIKDGTLTTAVKTAGEINAIY